ncbi:MAG: ABC transporter ATP-binding protein [Planctomycetota bacterium]
MNRFSSLQPARQEPEASASPLAWVWAIFAGLMIPVIIVVFGLIATLLDRGGFSTSTIAFGAYLKVGLPAAFLSQDPLTQLAELVALSVLLTGWFCLAVWFNRRGADQRTRRVVKQLHTRVLHQSLRRAEVEGAAAQRRRAESLIGQWLPDLGRGLSLWYRSVPRSILLFFGCVALALSVNPWLAVLAVCSGVVIWKLYQRLRNPDWLELSRFEIPQIRKRLISTIGDAPMMARLQAGQLADQTFDAELQALDRRVLGDDARRGRLWPLLMFSSTVAIAVILLGLGVNSLGDDVGMNAGVMEPSLSLPAALVLGLALTGSAFAAARFNELATQLRRSGRACEAVYLYLEGGTSSPPSEQRVGLAGLRESVAIDDVTLLDAAGKPILRDLSLSLQPKSMVAMLGTEDVSTRAMVELLMGFGRPSRGRVRIDGVSLLDVHPKALARNVMWVAPDGPLWEATLTENLLAGIDGNVDKRDMVEALEQLGVYETITRLPDGLDTFLQPTGDQRDEESSPSSMTASVGGDGLLDSDMRYCIGIARAMLHRPPIVLAKEPPAPTGNVQEDPCLVALAQLAKQGSLVIVLPHRIKTLRSCDRVVLLNGPNLAGEGNHADLLNTSDLYRHLNYLLFNPYRHRVSN